MTPEWLFLEVTARGVSLRVALGVGAHASIQECALMGQGSFPLRCEGYWRPRAAEFPRAHVRPDLNEDHHCEVGLVSDGQLEGRRALRNA